MTAATKAKSTTTSAKAKPTAPAAKAKTPAPAAAPVPQTKAAKSLKELAAKAPTALHQEYHAWLAKQGVMVDLKTLQIVCITRDAFQKSDVNQKHLTQRRAQAAAKAQLQTANRKQRLTEQLAKIEKELGKGKS